MAEAVGFRIRPATEADLVALEWGGEYRRFRRLYRTALEEAKRGERVLLVAEVQAGVVGQIFVQLGGAFAGQPLSSGYLYAFRVRPEYRNMGLGTGLVAEAEAVLQEKGFTQVVIAVAKDNARALRLYERLGYSRFGEDPGQWSYIDDRGKIQDIVEPAFLLAKPLIP